MNADLFCQSSQKALVASFLSSCGQWLNQPIIRYMLNLAVLDNGV